MIEGVPVNLIDMPDDNSAEGRAEVDGEEVAALQDTIEEGTGPMPRVKERFGRYIPVTKSDQSAAVAYTRLGWVWIEVEVEEEENALS